jgi:hypothetical protein
MSFIYWLVVEAKLGLQRLMLLATGMLKIW